MTCPFLLKYQLDKSEEKVFIITYLDPMEWLEFMTFDATDLAQQIRDGTFLTPVFGTPRIDHFSRDAVGAYARVQKIAPSIHSNHFVEVGLAM